MKRPVIRLSKKQVIDLKVISILLYICLAFYLGSVDLVKGWMLIPIICILMGIVYALFVRGDIE